jgi:hypothetical protein
MTKADKVAEGAMRDAAAVRHRNKQLKVNQVEMHGESR